MEIKKKDKVFIAGHKGLVGSAVYRRLVSNNYKRIIIADKKKLDLLDQKKTFNFLERVKPAAVILCAAKVGGIRANNSYGADFIYENLQIQNNIIYGCYRSKVKKLIFLGSSCIYPSDIKRKIKESDLLSGRLEKTNEPYAIAKISGIKMCESFNKQYKTNYLCLMPCNIFGPGDNYDLQNSHFIPAILKKIYLSQKNKLNSFNLWGTGRAKREVLFSEDLADAILFFLKKKKIYHSLINIGSKTEMTIKAYANNILKILNVNLNVCFDKNKNLDGTIRKKLDTTLAESYGWKSKIAFDDAIKKSFIDLVNKENA